MSITEMIDCGKCGQTYADSGLLCESRRVGLARLYLVNTSDCVSSAVHSTLSYPCAKRSRISLIQSVHFQVNVCTLGRQRVNCIIEAAFIIDDEVIFF